LLVRNKKLSGVFHNGTLIKVHLGDKIKRIPKLRKLREKRLREERGV